jgi:hypothetical protein
MEQSSFAKLVKTLEVAYPYYFKDLSKENALAFMQLYYSNLKKYRYEIVAKVISNIIKTSEYMPTIAQLIKECDNESKLYYREILENMYRAGYFKTDEEYGKAVMWLLEEKPLIPEWLEKDIIAFESKKELTHNE